MPILILAFALGLGGDPDVPAPLKDAATAKGVVAPTTSLPGEPPYGVVQGRYVQKGRQVCFRDPVSGSKIPTRRCMSREAFLQRQQDSKDHLDAIQRDARAQGAF